MLPPIRASQNRIASPRRTGPGGFTLPESVTQEAQGAAPVSTFQGMLGLQEGWSPAEADAAAKRRGHALLRELDALQLAMLEGGMEPGRLSRLALLAEGEAGADPDLREILEAISLRARVELARRGP